MARFVSIGKRQLFSDNEPLEAYWIEVDRSMLFGIARGGGDENFASRS
jgi:hypothetical protein